MKFSRTLFTQNDGKIMMVLAFVILISAFFLAGGYFRLTYSPKDTTEYANPIYNGSSNEKNLQIDYFKFGSRSATTPGVTSTTRPPTPTPGKPVCLPKYTDIPRDQVGKCVCGEIVGCKYKVPRVVSCPTPSGQMSLGCITATECHIGSPYCEQMLGIISCPDEKTDYNGITAQQCTADFEAGLCEIQCLAKPVIYLYPTKPLLVNVKLELPGRVTVSDPLYPENGWKNVYAYPNPKGAVQYEGKDYPYLYYESDVMKPKIPTQGFVVKTELLEQKLKEMTGKLGLIEHEQKDFVEYWVPKLKDENKPYMFITVLPHDEKEKVDKVIMSVEPTTRIEMIFEFEPLDEFKVVLPLEFPATPPKRTGFTMVEWGGAIN